MQDTQVCETPDICGRSGSHGKSRAFSLQNTHAEVATLAICSARPSGCPRDAGGKPNERWQTGCRSARRRCRTAKENATKSAGTGQGTGPRREIDQRRCQDLRRPPRDDLRRHRGVGGPYAGFLFRSAAQAYTVPFRRSALLSAAQATFGNPHNGRAPRVRSGSGRPRRPASNAASICPFFFGLPSLKTLTRYIASKYSSGFCPASFP